MLLCDLVPTRREGSCQIHLALDVLFYEHAMKGFSATMEMQQLGNAAGEAIKFHRASYYL